MTRDDIQFWIAVITLVVAAWPLAIWIYSRRRKLSVSTSPLSWATLSEAVKIEDRHGYQRIAVMLDIDIRNTLNNGVTIESYRVEYRCHMLKFQDRAWWKKYEHLEKHIEHLEFLYQWTELQGPIPMQSPASVIGEKNRHRKMPHRLVNFTDLGITAVGNYLQNNEANTGVLLYESRGYFWGGGRPYPRSNGTIPIRCTVHDGRGVKSSAVLEVRLVDLSLARTSHPNVLLDEENEE